MTAVARIMDDRFQPVLNLPVLDIPVVAPAAQTHPPFEAGKAGEEGGVQPSLPASAPADSLEPARRIALVLRGAIGEDRYDLWFDRKSHFALEGNTLVVEVFNTFAAGWITTKFRTDLLAAARQTLGREVDLVVRVGTSAGMPPGIRAQESLSGQAVPASTGRGMFSSGYPSPVINPKYTLEEFIAGPSNQLAYRAAQRVAEEPARQFNPLFIHGHCGLGKTHLLQGICQRFAKLHPGKKWLYLTAEQFTNEFLEALRSHKTDSFRRRIRGAELLVLDDVHFLANKKATQEEFLHTFNQVDASGKQIVLASDCTPKQIHSLSEQLSSRFVSGMVLRVDSPDLPTRLEILRRRVLRNGWNVADPILMHIARTATSSVRELEGLLLQVIAGISLINTGSPQAGAVMASIKERTAMRGPVSVERILDAVSEHFALPVPSIVGRSREKPISLARAVALYLARQHTGMSFPEIGRALGKKNHSTVIAACQRIEALITGGRLLSWNTPAGPRHQSISDALHELEAAIRRTK